MLFEVGSFKVQNQQVLAIFSIIILTIINNRGVKSGKNLQFVFTAAKLLALFALIIFGKLFGFFGVLLALPASAVSLVLIQFGWSLYIKSSWYQGQ